MVVGGKQYSNPPHFDLRVQPHGTPAGLLGQLFETFNDYARDCNHRPVRVPTSVVKQYDSIAAALQDSPPPSEQASLPFAPRFCEWEFGCSSQNTEDGILLYICAIIGSTNKKSVEIAGGIGSENNSVNLALNHGWKTLMVDGDHNNYVLATKFFKRMEPW